MKWDAWKVEVLPQITDKKFENFGQFVINGQGEPILDSVILFWRVNKVLPDLPMIVSYHNHLQKEDTVIEIGHGTYGFQTDIKIVNGKRKSEQLFVRTYTKARKRPISEGL